MKHLASMVLAAVVAWSCGGTRKVEKPTPVPEAAPPVVEPAPPPPPPPATLLLQRDAQSPVVVVRLVFRAGSADDPGGGQGLTELTALLMAQATQALDSAQLPQALFPYATDVGVQVDRETTVFSMAVHREVALKALPIFFDCVHSPRFDSRDFERTRRDLVTDVEKRLRQADDENLGKAALQAALWKGHPYGHPPGGHVAALQAATLEQVRAHREAHFTQARLVAGLGGGFDDEVEAFFRAQVERLPRGDASGPVVLPAIPQVAGLKVHIIQKDTGSTPITLGYGLDLKRSDPDFVPVLLANSAFGEHRQMGGRLFLKMREIRGLNYGDYSYVEHFVEEGGESLARLNIPCRQQQYTLWVRPVEPDDRVFALRQAVHELRLFASSGLTQEEFERTRHFLQGYTRLWEQGTSRKLGWALDDQINGTPDFLRHLRERLETLTLDEVNAAVKRHVRADNLVITVLARDAEALRQQLVSGAPSPRAEGKTRNLDKAQQEEDAAIAQENLKLTENDVTVTPVSALF